jgi:RNA polymerase sigma-70 factor (ECF subfamily)
MALEDLHAEGIEAWPDPGVAELPEAILERREMAERVEEVLSELPPEYERILRNHYQEEKPVKVIAKAMEITPKAVEARLFRARNAFREAFRALACREDQAFREVRHG